VLSCVGR